MQIETKLHSLDNQYRAGWTNTSAALFIAREKMFTKDGTHDRPDVDDVILLFTDSKSNKHIPGSDAITEGTLNHAAGERLFSITLPFWSETDYMPYPHFARRDIHSSRAITSMRHESGWASNLF